MELVQLHAMEPLSARAIGEVLADSIPAEALDPRGGLGVRVAGPWRPADVWPGGIERLVWSATFEAPRDRFLLPEAFPTLMRRQLARPHHPVHPGEAVARRLGGALLVSWSDTWQLAMVTNYRDRRIRWSLLLEGAHGGREADAPDEPRVEETADRYTWDSGEIEEKPTSRMVRCDGVTVMVEAPVAWVPEGDRTGVLLAGLDRFFTEPLDLDLTARLTLPDTLAALVPEGPPTWLARDGRWLLGASAAAGPPRAASSHGHRLR